MAGIEVECCEEHELHNDLLENVHKKMPAEEEISDLSDYLRCSVIQHGLKILFVLFEAEVCVCDLAELLSMTQSAISHQLKVLKQSKLVNSRREGKSFFIRWQMGT